MASAFIVYVKAQPDLPEQSIDVLGTQAAIPGTAAFKGF